MTDDGPESFGEPAVLETDAFTIGPVSDDGDADVKVINHFEVDGEYRGKHVGSAVLETLKRVYYYEGYEAILVCMGGGDAAGEFLEANGFTVVNRRSYQTTDDVGVDAVFTYGHDLDDVADLTFPDGVHTAGFGDHDTDGGDDQ